MNFSRLIFRLRFGLSFRFAAEKRSAAGDSANPLSDNAGAVIHYNWGLAKEAQTFLHENVIQWLCASVVIGIVGGLLFFLIRRTGKSRTGEAQELTSAQLAVIAVAVGAAFGFGGAMLSKHDYVLDLLAAAVSSVLVIQISETMRFNHSSKRMQSLERALASDAMFYRLEKQLDNVDRLSALLQRYHKARPLFDEFLADTYNALTDSLESYAVGTIHVDEPARELTFNKDCLDHLANKEVWAVSFQDGSFWDEPEGKDFLALHDQKLRAGVVIHRIFLLTNCELVEQTAIIEAQMKRGIHCRILLLESKSGNEIIPEDFVVYDDEFVRAANLVAEGPTTTLKRAVLSCDPRKVRYYLQKRNELKTRSEPAEDLLKRRNVTSDNNSMSVTLDSPMVFPKRDEDVAKLRDCEQTAAQNSTSEKET